MIHNDNDRYTIPEQDDVIMAHESVALRYNNIETLKLQCLEKVMQLNDSSMLIDIIHRLNDLLTAKSKNVVPYTQEELEQRCDEATAELEAGGGIDGEQFFKELNAYIETL